MSKTNSAFSDSVFGRRCADEESETTKLVRPGVGFGEQEAIIVWVHRLHHIAV